MARVILHVGTHKTGTTSIQKTLNTYRGKLKQRGIHYPNYETINRKQHYAHFGVANALAEPHAVFTRQDSEVFFSSLAKDKPADDVVLVSAESMYRQCIGPTQPQETTSAHDYWEMRHAYIREMRALTGPAEIAIVLRNQPDFAESMYQEHVKVTRYSGDFAQFLKEFWFHFQYYEQVMAWKEHFGKVTVLSFEDLKGPNITKRFLNSLGLKPGRVTTGPIQNVGTPHDGIILKRAYNKSSLERDQLKTLAAVMATDEAFLNEIGPAKRSFFPDAAARRAFHESYRAGNEKLIEMGDLNDPSLLVSPPKKNAVYGDTISAPKTALLTNLLGEAYPPLAKALGL